MSIANEVVEILADLESLSLEEIQRASLLRRKDQKYIFSTRLLAEILKKVSGEYRILDINAERSQFYRTYYYDTPELEMYHKHHRGFSTRHKVRIREYTASDLRFLEVKRKNAKGITSKKRTQTRGMEHSDLAREGQFLEANSPYVTDGVSFALENEFKRITLVSRNQGERVTMDYQLKFAGSNGTRVDLPGVCVTEIKYEGHLAGSPMHRILRQSKIVPRRFSKYAIGMALLDPELKQNRFKQKVRSVHQINSAY